MQPNESIHEAAAAAAAELKWTWNHHHQHSTPAQHNPALMHALSQKALPRSESGPPRAAALDASIVRGERRGEERRGEERRGEERRRDADLRVYANGFLS